MPVKEVEAGSTSSFVPNFDFVENEAESERQAEGDAEDDDLNEDAPPRGAFTWNGDRLKGSSSA